MMEQVTFVVGMCALAVVGVFLARRGWWAARRRQGLAAVMNGAGFGFLMALILITAYLRAGLGGWHRFDAGECTHREIHERVKAENAQLRDEITKLKGEKR